MRIGAKWSYILATVSVAISGCLPDALDGIAPQRSNLILKSLDVGCSGEQASVTASFSDSNRNRANMCYRVAWRELGSSDWSGASASDWVCLSGPQTVELAKNQELEFVVQAGEGFGDAVYNSNFREASVCPGGGSSSSSGSSSTSSSGGTAQAGKYYVDPVHGTANCSASQTGCNGTACSTFAKLTQVVALKAGDVVNFCSGTYHEPIHIESGTAGKPITYQRASADALPIIAGTDECKDWRSEGNGVYSCAFSPEVSGCTNGIQKLFVDGKPLAEAQADGCPSTTDLANAGYCANWPSVDCSSDTDCTGLAAGDCVKSKWCWNKNASGGARVYAHLDDQSNLANHTVEVGSRDIIVFADHQENFTIDGLDLFGAEGICTNRSWAMEIGSAGPGVTIRNSSIKYSGTGGIYITGAKNAVIHNNLFEDMGSGWSYPPNASAAMTIRAQNSQESLTITDNRFNRNGTHLWFHVYSSGQIVNNCGVSGPRNTAPCYSTMMSIQSPTGLLHIDRNQGNLVENGIDIEPVYGAVFTRGSTVSGNTFVGYPHASTHDAYQSSINVIGLRCTNATGATVACSSLSPAPIFNEFRIEKNEILGGFRTGIGVSAGLPQGSSDRYSVLIANNIVRAGDRSFGNLISAALRIDANSNGVKVHNNTFQCEKNTAGKGSGVFVGTGAKAEFRNNIFDFDGCLAKFSDQSGLSTWGGGTDNLCDVASSGKCKAGANNLMYVNESGANLRLLDAGNTDAKGKATKMTLFSDDVDGEARASATPWDIGADQVTH